LVVIALPVGAVTVTVPGDAWATKRSALVVWVAFVVADPGPGGYGAEGEPDETGGTVEHVIALVVVVPVRVVWQHMMCGGGGSGGIASLMAGLGWIFIALDVRRVGFGRVEW